MIDMEQLNEQSLPPFAPMAIGASKSSVDRSEGLFSSVSAEENKFWVVAVNMGYGHQRTAYPLKRFAARGNIINANDYCGITEKDKNIWDSTRGFYEFISRFKKIPLIGDIAFRIYDKFQEIPSFYPKRDLSKPTIGLDYIYSMIKNGWGKDLILKIGDSAIPLVSTFFIPAFMAEEFGYPGEIFCVICDTDVSRTWADLNPAKSRIKYFAPNSWVVNRLKLYGVKEENIFLTEYEKRNFAVKPMNCPGGILLYKLEPKSYKDLPLKVAELGIVHRQELSGVLGGLFRVIQFIQDDAHIYCTEEQLEEEINNVFDLTEKIYNAFNLNYYVVFK